MDSMPNTSIESFVFVVHVGQSRSQVKGLSAGPAGRGIPTLAFLARVAQYGYVALGGLLECGSDC